MENRQEIQRGPVWVCGGAYGRVLRYQNKYSRELLVKRLLSLPGVHNSKMTGIRI